MPRKANAATGATDQQLLFADEYLVDFNAVAAYIRAGYKGRGKSADAAASRLLANPAIREYLQKRRERISSKLELTTEKVLTELQRVAFFDPRRVLNGDGAIKKVEDWDDHSAAAVQSLEVFEEFDGKGEERERIGVVKKLKLHPKVPALERLGQHLGLFKQPGDKDNPLHHEHHVVQDLVDAVAGADTGLGSARGRGKQRGK